MKRAALGIAMAVILCGSAPRGQKPEPRDPFNGTWRLNVEKTKQMSGGISPASEVTTFRIGPDNVQHIHVEAQSQPNAPVIASTYATKYNDPTWVPYTNAGTGKPTYVMTIKVDDRTHYRIARDPSGAAMNVLMRRLSEDGRSYQSYGMTTDGKVTVWRYFDRVE